MIKVLQNQYIWRHLNDHINHRRNLFVFAFQDVTQQKPGAFAGQLDIKTGQTQGVGLRQPRPQDRGQ